MQNNLIKIIQQIEIYCKNNTLGHRFVGSVSYGGLLNKKTTYTIDITKKKVSLQNHNQLTILRTDDTIRDIDIILFCNNKNKITDFKNFLTQLEEKSKQANQSFPLVSYEATMFPSFGKRNTLFQFVYGLDVDTKNQLFLCFDDVKQQISWKSVDPWTVILEDGTEYTTRNPVADYYAYQFRTPSGIRPKDREKVALLKKMAHEIIERGKKYHVNYYSQEYYSTWQTFIEKLEKSNNTRIMVKKELSKYYWLTIGTYFAHGKGIGKMFLSLSNQFTGVRQ